MEALEAANERCEEDQERLAVTTRRFEAEEQRMGREIQELVDVAEQLRLASNF